ncbi:hypothetical protein GF366_00200, partial [Candidatus Peregrinibacteria bacterium]|nr:hypothetical protein [Candidatus Peregrinibacteria bacterium]
NKYTEELKNYENYPKNYYLTAEQEYLDPSGSILNRSIEEIELSIQKEELPDTPEMKQLASLRDALIDYSKGLKEQNSVLSEIDDYSSLSSILVETDQSVDKFASLTLPEDSLDSNNPKNVIKTDFFGEGVKESLLAAKIDIDPGTAFDSEEAPAEAPTGFYVVVEDQNENVLNYTEELGKTVHTLFSDVDGDGDHDIIYSLGGDVYLKENHKFDIELPKGEVVISAMTGSVSDYANTGSVQTVSTVYQGHEQIDISWHYQENAVGYEVIIRKSLMDDEEDAVYRYEIDDPQKTNLSVEIENGNYYVTVYSIDKEGNRSTSSNFTVAAPQACADNDPPFPAITKTEYDLSVFKQLEIDASGSFDPSGEIEEYSLENLPYSKEGEGKFMIGPFINEGDLGLHEAVLNIVDQSNNSSAMKLGINVFAPEITLNETFGRTSVATGSTEPMINDLPFSLMRNRYIYRVVDGVLKMVPRIDKVITESATFDNGKYYTDDGGEYEISDFNLEDMILVENENGETIAEINPETGNIGSLADNYSTDVNPSSPPLSPLNINIVDEDGNILGTVYAVSDPNIDVKINEEIGYEGVFVNDSDINDSFELMSFPADHPNYPGGAALVYVDENKQMATIDTSGNIILLDKRIAVRQKKNDHKKDPLVIELLFEGKIVCEVHIKAGFRAVQIVGPDDVPFTTPRSPSASVFYAPSGIVGKKLFVGVDEDLNRIVSDLYAKGIIEAEKTDQGLVLNPGEIVNRAEYVKTMLNMLCIIPRPEAYEPYTQDEAEGGYSDIIFDSENLPWYYPYIKEADLLGLVYGYRGEVDPETGLPPFRPEAPISRAEAVNIILEALEYKGIIDLSELSVGDPWYVPFMEAAQDLTPYVVGQQYIKNNFIITPEEAQSPEEEMTREELFIMSSRVLDFYNCFEIDQDNDGMSDFCEEKYNISNPQNDVDDDGVININECYYGLDPTDKDTDGGGMSDGKELEFGTDPLDPTDDPEDDDNDGLTNMAEILIHNTDPNEPDTDEGGVNDGDEVDNLTDPLNEEDDFDDPGEYKTGESGYYIVPAECNTCPCLSTFLHSADIIPGDIFFTVISTYDESYIFSKSNEVTVNSVIK